MTRARRFVITDDICGFKKGDIFEQAFWNINCFIWDKSPAFDKEDENSFVRNINLNTWFPVIGEFIEWIEPIKFKETLFIKNKRMIAEKNKAWKIKRKAEKLAVKEDVKPEPVDTKPKRKRIAALATKILY